MYKEEKVIDGVLCIRSSPKSEFRPLTPEQLTERVLRLESLLKTAKQIIKQQTIKTK